jgi:hypothetical protein
MRIRLVALSILLLVPTLGRACSVPVFRYALERWDLAKYEISVFYERVLPAELEAALKKLEAGSPKGNWTVVRVDLQGDVPPEYAKQWALQSDKKTLPWLAARLPETSAKMPDAWAGPFTQENLRRLLDSPARQRLVKQLSQGATAVFLLLPGKDEAANKKAAELLDRELARLSKIVQLPEPSPDGPQIRTGVPLKIEFVTQKLDRADPAEQAFVQSLINSDEDLSKVRGPIVLPVFGRGRLLCSLFGQDLDREQLAGVVRFLCGECSCTVKELNPGADLLIAADWHDILEKAGPPMPNAAPQISSPVAIAVADTKAPAPVESGPPVAASVSANENDVVLPSVPVIEEGERCGGCFVSDLATYHWLLASVGAAAVLVLLTGMWTVLRRQP